MRKAQIYHPNHHVAECEAYLTRSLNRKSRLLHAELLAKSTREAPWLLEVEVSGVVQKFVLRLDGQRNEHEFMVLRAMQSIPIPIPQVYGWDPDGNALGVPCFLCDFIEGESLREPVLAGEDWAEDLFLETVYTLQKITSNQLSDIEDRLGEGDTAEMVLEAAYQPFKTDPHPLAGRMYTKLKETMPQLPKVRYSNGDLWLDNFIVRDRKLAGVIDFENAGFSDPIFEFMLSSFILPDLRASGIEERYCERMGFDPGMLGWYRGLEYFDTWSWVKASRKPFEQYTQEILSTALERWLDEFI